jgi:hypothetical protein
MRATISILGLYNLNDTLFDDLVIPENMDSELLINNLVTELAELELIYSDFNFMKFMIGVWSRKELPTWERVYKASTKIYDPIENYDRIEEWHDNLNSNSAVNSSMTGNGSTQHDVAGFNTNALVNASKDTNTESNTGFSSDTSASNGSHTGRVHGNIGVTTSQQMLQSELDIAPKLNPYDFIINSFKNRFCLQVY